MKILGYTFTEMTDVERQAFQGAESGTLICNDVDDHIFLWDPAEPQTLYEVRIDSEGRSSEWLWKCEEINTDPEYKE